MLSHAGHFHIAPGTDRQTLSPPGFVRQMIHRLHAQFMRVRRLSCERALGRVDALICTICKCFRKLSGVEQGNARGCVLRSIVNIHLERSARQCETVEEEPNKAGQDRPACSSRLTQEEKHNRNKHADDERKHFFVQS